jgi:hypothetical protein
MRARGTLVVALIGVLGLWLAPSALADQLLETVSVDAGSTNVAMGIVQLTTGTKYQLQVSGTFTLANGYGQSYDEDALYCYGDQGFDSPQCTPPTRMGDFYVGSGSSSLKNIDAYQQPGGGGSTPSYSSAHGYTVDFYPPANGALSAGGTLAYSQCKSQPTPCTTQVTGTITIQIYGPAASGGGGGGGSSGGGAPSGWMIGGGSELYPPMQFCRVQRGFPPASDPRIPGYTNPVDCVDTKLSPEQQKAELRLDAKAALLLVGGWCQAAGAVNGFEKYLVATRVCAYAVAVYLEIATQLVHDPPDRRFWAPPGFATVPSLATEAAAIACPHNLSRAQCAAFRTASTNYIAALNGFTSLVGYVAIGADRAASAVAANSPMAAFFQEAFAKVNEGAVALQAVALRSYANTLARLLRADHLDAAVSAKQAKMALSKHPPHGVSKAKLQLIIRQLSSRSSTSISAILRSSLPTATFAAAYKSISFRDLAVIVNGLVVNGNLPVAVGKTLANDLANAQSVCTNPSARIAAVNRFVADLHTYAPSEAKFLGFGAQPLLAHNVPLSSCPATSG